MSNKLIHNVVFPVKNDLVNEFQVTKWHKKIGDSIQNDEPLYSISNDYFEIETLSPYSGTLIEILVNEGEYTAVDTILARIECR